MNKIYVTALMFGAVLSLSACGRHADQPADQPIPAAHHKAAPKVANAPVEEALAKIPPEQRADFQKALQCDVKKAGKGVQITAPYIGDLYARMKADPTISKC